MTLNILVARTLITNFSFRTQEQLFRSCCT